jgi:hypothetical protein
LPKDSCRIKHAAVTLESSWIGESFVEGNRYPDDLFQRASDYYTRVALAEAQPDPFATDFRFRDVGCESALPPRTDIVS